MPSCDHLYATDFRWWKHHIGDVTRDYEGICWTIDVGWETDAAQWGIRQLKADVGAGGLSRTQGVVHTGKNSGYAAINLAYLLGAERILLLGYDMQMAGDKRHWFGAHPGNLEVTSCYPSFILCFQTIKPADYGIEVWNCTRRTALEAFPIHDLDEVCAALS